MKYRRRKRACRPYADKDRPGYRVIYAANDLWQVQKEYERPDKGSIIGKDVHGRNVYEDWRIDHGWENIGGRMTKKNAIEHMMIVSANLALAA